MNAMKWRWVLGALRWLAGLYQRRCEHKNRIALDLKVSCREQKCGMVMWCPECGAQQVQYGDGWRGWTLPGSGGGRGNKYGRRDAGPLRTDR